MTLQLDGFEEMIKKLEKAGRNVDFEVEKCFSQCAKVMTETLIEKAEAANLDQNLIEKIEREKWHKFGKFHFAVGWEKVKRTYGSDPLPDVYKVMFYNYGTPVRTTKSGENRGEERGRGFIKKAKLASKNKVRKIQRDFLANVMKELER